MSSPKILCAIPECQMEGAIQHPILAKDLFPQSWGEVEANLIPLCVHHADDAQRTRIQPAELWDLSIYGKILPQHLDPDRVYDRYGNIINHGGSRFPGELFYDAHTQAMLKESKTLELFAYRLPFPKTFDYNYITNNNSSQMDKYDRFIITELMPGDTITMYRDSLHDKHLSSAISKDSYLKSVWDQSRDLLEIGITISGQDMSAFPEHNAFELHTMAIWLDILEWGALEYWSDYLGLPHVPVIAVVDSPKEAVDEWYRYQKIIPRDSLGFYIRPVKGFSLAEYSYVCAAWRKDV